MADKPDWLKLAREGYSASTTYFDSSIRRQIEGDLRQFQGLHPAGSKYLADVNKSRSRLFRPKTRTAIRKNEAIAAEAFFSTVDVLNITAENDDDKAQQASAAIMKELLQHRLTKSIPWFQTVIGAYQDALTVGVVASYQYWEYSEKKKIDKPCIRLVPIENIRFDPGAHWTDPVNTSPYIIEMVPMYVKDVKARMRTVDKKTGEAKWKTLPDATILTAIKQYGDSIRLIRENQRTDSKDQQTAVTEYSVVWIHKNIVEVDEVDYVYYTLGTEQMLSDPVELDQAYFHGKRPYVIGSCVIETHKNYPSGLPRLGKDVQSEINEIANSRIDNVKFALNKRYFAKRNSQVDLRSLTRNVPGSVTLMTSLDDVKEVSFNDVTGSSYREQENLNLDFDDIAGTFANSSVQSNRQLNETVGGMDMLNTNSNQVSAYQLRTFVETWVEPVLRQMVLLEQFYETDEVLMALAGNKAQLMQKFGINAVTDELLMAELTLNVNVGMGATNQRDQIKQFMLAMGSLKQLLSDGTLLNYGLDVQEVITELFSKLGYRDGGRFFKTDDATITGLQGEIQKLQQQLSQKVDPQLVAAQIAKIDAEITKIGADTQNTTADAVKKGVEAAFSAMQSAEVIAAVPQVAPIADALMQAAGYQAPASSDNPQFPTGAPAPGLTVQDITNKRTGVGFTPGGVTTSTTLEVPQPAAPATPGIGERHGIETTRPDSAPGFADGGMVGEVGIDGLTDDQRLGLHYVNGGTSGVPQGGNPFSANDMVHMQKVVGFANSLSATQQAVSVAPNALNSSVVSSLMADSIPGAAPHSHSTYKDGGQIQGPGTGTSDSIPAQVGDKQIKVSNGEFYVPPAVVSALGIDFFEHLIEQFHTDAPAGNNAPPVSVSPLVMDDGGFIIPADVVEKLGKPYFDELLKKYQNK